MGDNRRMFVAIELSEEAIAEINRLQLGLERAGGDLYRLAPSSNLHLTLYFLGQTAEATSLQIAEKLSAVRFERIELTLGHLVKLPSVTVPKILAVGIQSAGLGAMHQRVHDLCFPIAEHKETRLFLPHVTFARLKNGIPASAKPVKKAISALGSPTSVRWSPAGFVIMSSQPGDAGPEYTVLARIPIG